MRMTLERSIDIPAQENSLQKYNERVKRLPQPDRLIEICTDAGILTTFEVGHNFMTEHTDMFSQFTDSVPVVSALCQEMKTHLIRKVGFERPKLGP